MTLRHTNERDSDRGVSNLVEFVLISGILVVLMMVLMLLVNAYIMEGTADKISYAALTDVGNGVSTRIVDLYIVHPTNGTMTTMFDIPDDITDKDYYVEIGAASGTTIGTTSQAVEVSQGDIKSVISLSGIGATKGIKGNTTGRGLNKITFDSMGV
jgi:hypothetical protein